MRIGVVAFLAVLITPWAGMRPGTAQTTPDLSWIEQYVGKPSTSVISDSHFASTVTAHLPSALVPLPGKPASASASAKEILTIPNTVTAENGELAAYGCESQACGELALLVLAHTASQPASLTLAFAVQKLNNGGHASPPLLMNLYLYSSDKTSEIPAADLALYQRWLQSSSIDHIDEVYTARGKQLIKIPTPAELQTLPRHNPV